MVDKGFVVKFSFLWRVYVNIQDMNLNQDYTGANLWLFQHFKSRSLPSAVWYSYVIRSWSRTTSYLLGDCWRQNGNVTLHCGTRRWFTWYQLRDGSNIIRDSSKVLLARSRMQPNRGKSFVLIFITTYEFAAVNSYYSNEWQYTKLFLDIMQASINWSAVGLSSPTKGPKANRRQCWTKMAKLVLSPTSCWKCGVF